MPQEITVIRGDGIGPEIMDASLRVLETLGADLAVDYQLAGLSAQDQTGELLPQSTLDSIARTGLALKAPLTTPVGGGFKSLNVALRKHFDLYANVRPAISFRGSLSRHENVDLITVRENTEGAYLGEGAYTSPDGSRAESKMIATRAGCERIVRFAFELARRAGRKRVTVVHKANILKDVTGMFLSVAREVASGYVDIDCDDMIVDNACMQLVMRPEKFDVIVTTNLFGDIISDLCAGLVGGLGLAPGANIGEKTAMFEAVHGSAPDIAGRGIANPCALLLAAAQMLEHMDLHDKARRLRVAIGDAIQHADRTTPDLGGHGTTEAFADALCERVR